LKQQLELVQSALITVTAFPASPSTSGQPAPAGLSRFANGDSGNISNPDNQTFQDSSLFAGADQLSILPIDPARGRPTPLPSGLPRFQRPSTSSVQTVNEFLTEFEDALEAKGYPRHRFVKALIRCCAMHEADWVRQNLCHLEWSLAKQRFKDHFISSDIYSFYADELESIQRGHNESVLSFTDR